jgi:ATP-dependent helicase HrpB
VATNIAETSLTVPGVTAVVDSGLHKVARYDADRGIDSLETERITADAADQRAGRAGRIAPGVVRRLWGARDRLRPHREPEIHRIDLASTALDVIAWGGDPRTLEWFEPPREEALAAALALLARLGLIDMPVVSLRLLEGFAAGRKPPGRALELTAIGDRAAAAAPPASGAYAVCRRAIDRASPAAVRASPPPRNRVDHVHSSPRSTAGMRTATRPARADQIAGFDRGSRIPPATSGIRNVRRTVPPAVLSGYPDRVAQRREPGSPNVLLASGTGATIARESGVRDGEFLVALDVRRSESAIHNQSAIRHPQSGLRGPQAALSVPKGALIRLASLVERDWLAPTSADVVHRFDDARVSEGRRCRPV